jgi:hypothetical protein
MNRQQKRLMEKLKKKSDKELLKDFKKLYPNMKILPKALDTEKMSYEDFINSVEITPQMAAELKQHDEEQRFKSQMINIDIYNKD